MSWIRTAVVYEKLTDLFFKSRFVFLIAWMNGLLLAVVGSASEAPDVFLFGLSLTIAGAALDISAALLQITQQKVLDWMVGRHVSRAKKIGQTKKPEQITHLDVPILDPSDIRYHHAWIPAHKEIPCNACSCLVLYANGQIYRVEYDPEDGFQPPPSFPTFDGHVVAWSYPVVHRAASDMLRPDPEAAEEVPAEPAPQS